MLAKTVVWLEVCSSCSSFPQCVCECVSSWQCGWGDRHKLTFWTSDLTHTLWLDAAHIIIVTHVFWKVKILHRTHTGNTKSKTCLRCKKTHIYVFCCQRYRHTVHSRMIRHQTAAIYTGNQTQRTNSKPKDIYSKIKIIWFWLVLPFKRLQPSYLITSSWIQTRVNQLYRSFWRYLGVVTFVQQTVKQNYFSRRCITNPSSHHTSAVED